MVWSVPEPTIDNPEEDSELKNSKETPEVLDAQAYDCTFVDSFLDFDSIVDWFEDMPAVDMASNNDNEVAEKSLQMVECDLSKEASFLDQEVLNGTEANATGSTRGAKMEPPECEKLGTLSRTVHQGTDNSSEPIANGSTCLFKAEVPESVCVGTLSCAVEEGIGSRSEPLAMEPATVMNIKGGEILGFSSFTIEERMGNIGLFGGCESLVVNGGNGLKTDAMNGENASESSESGSVSPSSSSSTSSCSDSGESSGGSSASDDEDKEKGGKKGEGQTGNIDVEFEEGEIKDSDERELDTENEDEDIDKMVSWTMIDEDGNDDDDEAPKGPIRSKNELKNLPSVPPVDVTLDLHHQMLPVGVVMSVLGAQVIVEGVEKHDPLNEGSILWMTESRAPLGIVDEIFGPVRNPYYVVRYNSEDEIPKGVQGGTLISFVQEFANHVLNNKDLYRKGYDASGDNDEELPYEADFSDDEKEAEYKRMQKTTKRKSHRNKAPQEGAVPTASAAPSHGLGSCPPFSGIGRGIPSPNIIVPQFPSTAAGINPASSGNWRNGNTFLQPPTSMLPNGFPADGVSGFSDNAHSSYQLPVLGIPLQRQSEPSQGLHPATVLPVVQPNIFTQPMYAQGLVGQNQMPFGLSSNHPHNQPPMYAGEQGFFPNGMQSEGNYNLHSGSIRGSTHVPSQFHPGNPHAPTQFHPGASANRGRRAFHRGGRRGWRPAK